MGRNLIQLWSLPQTPANMSADAFFAPATHALEAEVEIEGGAMAPDTLSLEEAFDVEVTAQLILDGGYKVVSTQLQRVDSELMTDWTPVPR